MMINSTRLALVRRLLKLSHSQLALKTGIIEADILRIESGFDVTGLSSAQYQEKLALGTGFPVDYFTQSDAIAVPLGTLLQPYNNGLVPPQDQDYIRALTSIQLELLETLFSSSTGMRLVFPWQLDMKSVEAAIFARSTLGLCPASPIKHLINCLEQNGAIVLPVALNLTAFKSFSFWLSSDYPRPVIVISSELLGDEQVWHCAYELGCLMLRQSTLVTLEGLHKAAIEFADEFLMPQAAILPDLANARGLTDYGRLKLKWKMSMRRLIKRAYMLGVSDLKIYNHRIQDLKSRHFYDKEPENLDVASLRPRLLMKLAELQTGIPVKIDIIARLNYLPLSLVAHILSLYDTYKDFNPYGSTPIHLNIPARKHRVPSRQVSNLRLVDNQPQN